MTVALRRGRQPKERVIHEVKALTRDDLNLLQAAREQKAVPLVQKFRDTHHRLARLMAAGLRNRDVAIASGYSESRVLMFSSDPAFMELVAHYRNTVTEGFKDEVSGFFEIATQNMVIAERQISEKLEQAEEDGTTLPTRELLAISRDAADRFGFGKHTMQTNVNVDFASQLEAAINRSTKVIEGQSKLVEGPKPPLVTQSLVTSAEAPPPAPKFTPRPTKPPVNRTPGVLFRRIG